MSEHAKVLEGGKEGWKLLDGLGRPGRDVKTVDWEMRMYINYCLFPIQNCINRMREANEFESETGEFVEMLDRLYDAALTQLGKMSDAFDKDMGEIEIITTNEDCRGGFLHQDFLEVYAKKKNDEAVTA